MSRFVILYRGREFEDDEKVAALDAGFSVTNSRMDIEPGDLVICRYSALPFYQQLETDIQKAGGRMLMTYNDHRYIADMMNWYFDLSDFTPKTWWRASDVPMAEPGSFVLKGETNSRKFEFDEMMFAHNREMVGQVLSKLQYDSLIGHQQIYVRRFEHFHTYKIGLHKLPITKEFRFFVAFGKVLSGGYYWSSHIDELKEAGVPAEEFDPNQVPMSFLQPIVDIVCENVPMVVIDVALRDDGIWRIVELNDLGMSGPSENDPYILYKNLMAGLKDKYVDIAT